MAREHRAPAALDQHSLSVAVQIQSIARAAAVLRLLTVHRRPRPLADLAAELRLPRGTVYGILRTLQTVGFVEQESDSRKYQLGPALLHIGSSYLNGSELRRRALDAAYTLATQAGEGVRIGTLHENFVLVVHHVPGCDERLMVLDVGGLMPLYATALGKALLANRGEFAVDIDATALASCTAATITDPDRLRAELSRISKRGWASEVGEFVPGARGGAVVGVIAISGPTERICDGDSPRSALVGYVMESARTISRQLGGRRW